MNINRMKTIRDIPQGRPKREGGVWRTPQKMTGKRKIVRRNSGKSALRGANEAITNWQGDREDAARSFCLFFHLSRAAGEP